MLSPHFSTTMPSKDAAGLLLGQRVTMAHVSFFLPLTSPIYSQDFPERRGWTLFSELRRTLQAIVQQAVFSLFLAMAGSFHPLPPGITSDPSIRITDNKRSSLGSISSRLPPISLRRPWTT
jgi:hypothetical protein